MSNELSVDAEELRALLVLGMVATLFTMAQLSPKHVFAFGLSFRWIAYTLLIDWGGYLFLAVVGLSKDCIKETLADLCRDLSKLCFLFGIGLGLGIAITIFLGAFIEPALTSHGINVGINEAGPAIAMLSFVFMYFVTKPDFLSKSPRNT